MHIATERGDHYKLEFKSDKLLLGVAEVAVYNELAEVVYIGIDRSIMQFDELQAMVRTIDRFLSETGASVAYINTDGLADEMIAEFMDRSYIQEWALEPAPLYKMLQ